MKKIIVIPARLSSSRLPRKVLLDLGGKSVLERVYDQCTKVKDVAIYIATDSVEVKDACSSFTNNVIMTDPKHESGTDRIVEVINDLQCDIVVNVQGDEPFIDPSLITNLFDVLEKDKNLNMSSVMEKIDDFSDLENPNVVKVVVNKLNEALYFSRSPIPYVRSGMNKEVIENVQFYKHVGVYGYRRNFLLDYSKMEKSVLEDLEKLEQLRVLDNGHKIRMIETHHKSLGIDTKEDYNNALDIIHESKDQ